MVNVDLRSIGFGSLWAWRYWVFEVWIERRGPHPFWRLDGVRMGRMFSSKLYQMGSGATGQANGGQ